MNKNSIVSIDQLSKDDILDIISLTDHFEKNPDSKILDGKIIASLFFEPSTRTRLSFETAVYRLGGHIIGFSDPATSSSVKGETLSDTIKMVENYADLIVIRHFRDGAAAEAARATSLPLINAGDGSNQHPSQTLLDLYSIFKTQGTLENLEITLVGDLKYGRTVHSLIMAMKHFNPTFNFVSCPDLAMPESYKQFCIRQNIPFRETADFSPDVINSSDIIYMTRVQRERFSDSAQYDRVKDLYSLRNSMLAQSKPNLKILHPLPRVNEINPDVDDNPKAYYFKQAKNGMFTRQAIICRALSIDPRTHQ